MCKEQKTEIPQCPVGQRGISVLLICVYGRGKSGLGPMPVQKKQISQREQQAAKKKEATKLAGYHRMGLGGDGIGSGSFRQSGDGPGKIFCHHGKKLLVFFILQPD